MKQSKVPITLLTLAMALSLSASGSQPAKADGLSNLPKKLFVATVGTAVGTPIAVVRCTHREVIKRTKEAYQLGNVPKPVGYVTAGMFGIPSGILFGLGVGAADGVVDGIKHSSDEPLNKGSVSLDELYF